VFRAEVSYHPPLVQLNHPGTPRLAAVIKSGSHLPDLISG